MNMFVSLVIIVLNILRIWDTYVLYSSGHLGESVPPNSGLLSVVKAHGYIRIKNRYKWSYPEDLLSEMHLANGTAVLLIRNPYRAFYSFANHIVSPFGHANISHFIGRGSTRVSFI